MKFVYKKIYYCLSISILLGLYDAGFGQTMSQVKDYTIGGTGEESLKKSIKTKDGGYLSIGYAHAVSGDVSGPLQGKYDFWAVKTNANDQIMWNRLLGSADNDFVYDVTEDLINGGYVIVGYTESIFASGNISSQSTGGLSDIWVVKISFDGTSIAWERRIGGNREDYGISILQINNGSFLISGFTNSEPNTGDIDNSIARGSYDFWLINLSSLGTVLWNKRIGGPGFDGVGYDGGSISAAQTLDGGYIIGGRSYSNSGGDKSQNSAGDSDFWVIKLDANLAIQWDVSLGGAYEEKFTSLIETSDGGYILAGTSSSPDPVQSPDRSKDYWIVKLDKSGAILWDYKYGGSQDEDLKSFIETSDGGFLLGGHSFSNIDGDKSQMGFGSADYWVVKLFSDGTKDWDLVFGGKEADYLSSVIETAENGLLLAGTSSSDISGNKTASSKGRSDFWLINLQESPLPIELISFEAKAISKNSIELSWITASETNNAFFNIERSIDAINFHTILEIAGAGNSLEVKSYSTIDYNPLNGIVYYRLKQIDFDGSFTFSKIVSATLGEPFSYDFLVLPNPSNGSKLTIRLNKSFKNQDIHIFLQDILGNIIIEKYYKSNQNEDIDLLEYKRHLEKGIYIITLITLKSTIKKKVLIN